MAQPACQCRRAHRRERRLEHRCTHLALPISVAEADREVQAFAGQVDAVVVGLDAQFDVRVARIEFLQPWQQPAGGEGAHHADPEHLAEMPADEAVQADRNAVERFVEHGVQACALVGERHPARQAMEQHRAQPFLQPPDLMAQRGLAYAQLQRRAGEVLVAGRGLEGAQGIERELGAKHCEP